MVDVSKAFEAENGFLVEDGPFYTGGVDSPVGMDLPTKTMYLQQTTAGILIWRKVGVGVNDWRQLSAQDVLFDNTGEKFNSTNIHDAIVEARTKTTIEVEQLTTSLNGSYQILDNDANVHIVTGTATGYSVLLPDATALFIGREYKVVNNSDETILLKDFGGNTLATLVKNDIADIILEDNTTSNGTWLITIITSAATGITSYVVDSNTPFVTSSTTDVLVTGFSVTPVQGRYSIYVSVDAVITANNALAEYVAYVDGSAVTNTRRKTQGVSSNYSISLVTIGEISVNGSQAVDVRVNISTSSLTVNSRSLILIRLGNA